MMIYGLFEVKSEFYPLALLMSEDDFKRTMMDDEVTAVSGILRFKVTGDDYEERKENLQELAITWSHTDKASVALVDEEEVRRFFEKNGKRYGLLREFRENAII